MPLRKSLLTVLILLGSVTSLHTQDKPQIFIRPTPEEEIILALPNARDVWLRADFPAPRMSLRSKCRPRRGRQPQR